MGPKKNKVKEESKKKSKEPKNARHWTDVQIDAYADVLDDPENSFAATLDNLALKIWPGMTNISMVSSSCQSPDPYQPVNSD